MNDATHLEQPGVDLPEIVRRYHDRVVDLRYQFVLAGDLISELVIAP